MQFDNYIKFIITNLKTKRNLKILDIATGEGGFIFELLAIKGLSFESIIGIDDGSHEEKEEDESFQEEFENQVSQNFDNTIPRFEYSDGFSYLEKTEGLYHIINVSNFLHFYEWDTICKYINLSLSKLKKDGRLFIRVASINHSNKEKKIIKLFSQSDILKLKEAFHILDIQENSNHFCICFIA